MLTDKQVEEETNVNNNCVSYKIYLYGTSEIRRLGFKKSLSFEKISQELVQLFPESSHESFKLMYQDEEGDFITVSSEREWKEALNVLKSSPITRLYVSFGGGGSVSVPKPISNSNLNSNPNPNPNPESCCRRKMRREGHCPNKFLERSVSSPLANNNGEDKMECSNDNKWRRCKRGDRSSCKVPSAALSDLPEGLKPGSFVYLKSKSTQKNLRMDGEGKIDALGNDDDKFAAFIVHKGVATPNSFRLQSVSDQKRWLRINKNGQLDGLGKGGPLTEFVLTFCRVKKNRKGGDNANPLLIVCLRSAKSNLGVGFMPDGTVKDPQSVGKGRFAKFFVLPCGGNCSNNNTV